jgi:hypothetical protein
MPLRTILLFGSIAGLIVAVPMFALLAGSPPDAEHGTTSMLIGYTLMLIALSFVFVGVKRHRDKALGGVIKFWPALLIGLAISAVAGIFYVVGWEITLALTDYAFLESYPRQMVAAAEAAGKSPAEVEAVRAEMAEFSAMYANPLMRVPMTFFVEIFPVGVIVSLITAFLLRNRRFLPARSSPATA